MCGEYYRDFISYILLFCILLFYHEISCLYFSFLGVWGAIKSIYQEADIKGCSFHWGRAVMRRVAKLVMKTAYDNDRVVHLFVRKVLALPYLPAAHIAPNFRQLQQETTNNQPLQRLVAYVNRTWLQSYVFAIHQWCIFQQTVRTNNDTQDEHICLYVFFYLRDIIKREINITPEKINGCHKISSLYSTIFVDIWYKKCTRILHIKLNCIWLHNAYPNLSLTDNLWFFILFTGWHNRLSSRSNGSKLQFYKLVPALPLLKEAKVVPRQVQLVEEQTLSRWQRATYKKTSDRLVTLWQQYQDRDITLLESCWQPVCSYLSSATWQWDRQQQRQWLNWLYYCANCHELLQIFMSSTYLLYCFCVLLLYDVINL